MNVGRIPEEVRDDIEDQSLGILEAVADHVVVIGGWAVRAVLGPVHGRFSLDVDAVAAPEGIEEVRRILEGMGFELLETDWGIRMFAPYKPRVDVGHLDPGVLEGIELRVEVSGYRMHDVETRHYYEFPPEETEGRRLRYHGQDREVHVTIPTRERLAANKLGLPVDFKNNYDAAMLLAVSDVDRVIEIILDTDDWRAMVLRRGPKQVGRFRQSGRIERVLARSADLDIDGYIRCLGRIQEALRD
jgi:hypothetical protein